MIRLIHDDPPVISSAPDEVVLIGPEDVDISLTPRAAIQAGGELIEKACQAVGKQALAKELGKRLRAQPCPEK